MIALEMKNAISGWEFAFHQGDQDLVPQVEIMSALGIKDAIKPNLNAVLEIQYIVKYTMIVLETTNVMKKAFVCHQEDPNIVNTMKIVLVAGYVTNR